MKSKLISYGIPLICALLPWQTQWIFSNELIAGEATPFGVLGLYLVEILLLIVIALSGRPHLSPHANKIKSVLVAVVAFLVLTTVWSLSSVVSVVAVVHVAFAALLFLTILDSRVDTSHVLWGFIVGLIIPVILGLVQFISGSSGAFSWLGLAARDAARAGDAVIQGSVDIRRLRAYGSFPHPNIFGGYLAVGLISVFAFWQTVHYRKQRIVLGVIAGLMAIGLVLTFSRSAWLGLALAVLTGAVILRVKKIALAKKIALTVTGVFIAAIFIASFNQIFTRPGSSAEFEQRSFQERSAQIQDYPSVLANHWLFGFGAHAYPFVYETVFPDRSVWDYQPVHNILLLLLAEVGVIGLGLMIFFAASIDRMNFARFPDKRAVAAFMMGNTLLFVLFFDHYLWTNWAGLALGAYVLALTVRLGEDSK